jgi:hypothetical protein
MIDFKISYSQAKSYQEDYFIDNHKKACNLKIPFTTAQEHDKREKTKKNKNP